MARAEAELTKAGIRAEQTKPPSGLTGGSCAYALRIGGRRADEAIDRVRGIPHGGVYCGDGKVYRQI